MRSTRDRGAAAVEFAIILPLLLILVAGIVDFGRLFYAEIIVSNAAREGVRMAAMGMEGSAQARVDAASPSLALVGAVVGEACSSTSGAAVGVSYRVTTTAPFTWLLLDAFAPIAAPQPEATASMRCGG